jgi:hypothetical protein
MSYVAGWSNKVSQINSIQIGPKIAPFPSVMFREIKKYTFYSLSHLVCHSSGKKVLKVYENRLLRRISGADSDRNSSRGMEKNTQTQASQMSIFTQ